MARIQRQTRQATTDPVTTALAAVAAERAGLYALHAALSDGLGPPLRAAVARILEGRGRVIVTGIGKSGHVGRKIAATLASTGTPAYFVHPAEAGHGDLGMIAPDDVVLALSWSGAVAELAPVIAYAARFGVTLVAMTSGVDSMLARAADIVLELPRAAEACPNGLAPTTSTTMQLALGDALAVALLAVRGFSARDFGIFHPGGRLGAGFKLVRDLMHAGAELPMVTLGTSVIEAIPLMTEKRFGCALVVDAHGRLAGIVTDGDLRRALAGGLTGGAVDAIMTRDPRTAPPDMLAAEALAAMQGPRPITVLAVVDDGTPVGLLHMHDLIKAGVA